MHSAYSTPFSFLVLVGFAGLLGCTSDSGSLFERVPASHTGIDFNNRLVEDDSLLNPLDFEYVYNGGGVAVGDFNNDDRPDLYFGGNVVHNRLYLNQGAFRFRDVTAAAGVAADDVWATGLTVVDINQDGWSDIYVSVGGPPKEEADYENQLYVNQGVGDDGIPRFEEKAEEYGIADPGYTTHAAFFDYDRDGDLDLYVLTNDAGDADKNAIRSKQTRGQALNADRLYRNDGDGTFTDVSDEAGIQIEGHGLGVAVTDINKDGWPDVYVANDFISNDLLYINNGDGTFTNKIDELVKHQPYSAMGVDVADINNDARDDIMVLDMKPPGRRRDQMMSRFFDYDSFQRALRQGYEPQYVRNMLQLNNGPTPDGLYSFSEIGQLAGVAATDWSWAPLLVDVNNDGRRDLFVSNGYGKDVTNLDFVERRKEILAFGTSQAQEQTLRETMMQLPDVELSNFIFENEGDLTFRNRTDEWMRGRPGLSNGAAVADLDGDGDLDLVANNINDEATVLENHADRRDSTHFLRVDLHGPSGNRAGLGAKVTLRTGAGRQYYDHSPYRGYQSTVENIVHFGLGANSTVDSLSVRWPDGTRQVRTDVAADQVLDVHYDKAQSLPQTKARSSEQGPSDPSYIFTDVTTESGLGHRHDEYPVDEFEEIPLLPHKLSQSGPGVAVADIDGNGLDDVFVGADRDRAATLFLQVAPGRFTERPFPVDAKYEDKGALFFDANGNGRPDLYVVSGGNFGGTGRGLYQDRLYLNEGDGRFRRAAAEALPDLQASGSVVTAADYDQDGDLDLFVGGRVRPDAYPLPPRSHLLRNDSDTSGVRFTDVTEGVAPALSKVGLVTDALWTDYNDDGLVDLLLAGEWMPLTLFENNGDRFVDKTEEVGLENTDGWWNGLTAGDFDRDGDTDYVAGNLGLNTRYEASLREPVRVHAKDFDQNGTVDPVVSQYVDGTSYPVHGRDELIDQIPGLKARFPTYREYAEASFDEVFTEEEVDGAYVAKAVRFESSYLENRGDGTFAVRALPRRVQTAPVFGMQVGDYTGDGSLDLLMVGNWYAPDLDTGRADAFVGALLEGDGRGHFSYVHYTESGFFVDGDAKALAEVAVGEGKTVVVATQNDGPIKAFERKTHGADRIDLGGSDRSVEVQFDDGSMRKEELYYGSGYLSQSSRSVWVPSTVDTLHVSGAHGDRRIVMGQP